MSDGLTEEDRREVSAGRDELAQTRTELARERSALARERSELAMDRTEWAQHRTILASDRTFSAWLRTGLSSMGVGIGIVELLRGDGAGGITLIIGVILILLGATASVLSFWRYIQVCEVLEERGAYVTPTWVAASMAGALVVVAALLLLQIFYQL